MSNDKKSSALRLVPSPAEPGPVPAVAEAEHDAARRASEILGNAVMHAAMSWVACCMEVDAHTVEVVRVGPGLFDAEVQLMSRSGGRATVLFLRVKLDLSTGPVLRCEVSPLHVE